MNTSHAEFPFCFPSDYLDRIYIFRSGNYIDVYMPSWSDLAFSKLGSYREQDLLDLNGLVDSNEMDWEEVEYLIQQEENNNVFPVGIIENIRHNWLDFLEKHRDKHELDINWGNLDPFDGWDD